MFYSSIKVANEANYLFWKSVILRLKIAFESFFSYCSKEMLTFVQFLLCSNLFSKCKNNCTKVSISFEQKSKNDSDAIFRSKITAFHKNVIRFIRKNLLRQTLQYVSYHNTTISSFGKALFKKDVSYYPWNMHEKCTRAEKKLSQKWLYTQTSIKVVRLISN